MSRQTRVMSDRAAASWQASFGEPMPDHVRSAYESQLEDEQQHRFAIGLVLIVLAFVGPLLVLFVWVP